MGQKWYIVQLKKRNKGNKEENEAHGNAKTNTGTIYYWFRVSMHAYRAKFPI